jgi:hypothetical protein
LAGLGRIYFVAIMDAEHRRVASVGTLYAPAVSAIAALAFRGNAGMNFRCIVVGKLVKLHARIIEPQCRLPPRLPRQGEDTGYRPVN